MFSGPVTIIASQPALASSACARSMRVSYSAFGNADSLPWVTARSLPIFSRGCSFCHAASAIAFGTLSLAPADSSASKLNVMAPHHPPLGGLSNAHIVVADAVRD